MLLSQFPSLLSPTSRRWLIGWESDLWLWDWLELAAETSEWPGICEHDAWSQWLDEVSPRRNSIQGKAKGGITSGIETNSNPWTEQRVLYSPFSLSNLSPRTWYNKFGYSGDSCFKQNWIQFSWHFSGMQILAFKWFVSSINKWQHYFGTQCIIFSEDAVYLTFNNI